MPISINGTGTISGISAGGLPSGIVTGDTISNGSISTADIADGSITAPKLGYQNFNFRNRIINGDMRIDQRNAGASSVPATDSYTYTSIDRYFTSVNTPATSTATRSTSAPATFLYSLKIGRSGSGTAGLNTLGQVIETDNSKDLAGSSVTLSFWAKIGASATFSSLNAYVYSGTTTDQSASSLRGGWTGQATVASTTVTLTTTWTKFSVTGAVGSSALQLAAQFVFTTVGAAGADDNLYITGVQLEAGSTATDFERRPIGTELALCQRYYEQVGGNTGDLNSIALKGYQLVGSYLANQYMFPVQKRVAPTATVSGTFTAVNCGQPTVLNSDTKTWSFHTLVSATNAIVLYSNNSGLITFSAEL
jgi:hypothetical protein